MKTPRSIRIGMMSVMSLMLVGIAASNAAAAINAYLIFKDSTGKETRVKINSNGTFTTPPLKAGSYSWSFGATQSGSTSSGSAGRSISSGGDRPMESLSLAYGVMVAPKIVPTRDAAHGALTGRRQHQPLTIRKEIDMSSPKLATAPLGTIVIDVTGDAVAGTVVVNTKDGNKMAMDSWDAK